MSLQNGTVLVLGAGINGVAIARELVLNGMSVCLVDQADIAGGTTAYSSRLIHGGLRYLEFGEFHLVRESLEERERLLQLAPHCVRPLHLFIPVQRRASGFFAAGRKFLGWPATGRERYVPRGLWLVRMGLCLYDWCARGSSLPRHRQHRLDDPAVPPVDPGQFHWLVSYYDAQIDYPERFVLAMLEDARRLAVEQGVRLDVFTYHRASRQGGSVTVQPTGSETGRSSRSAASAGDTTHTFQPAAIVNATGAWVDRTLAQLQVASPQLVGGTKGSHFLTRHERLRAALADKGVYAEARDGRPVFLLPYGPYTLVGTTDLPVDIDPALVTADDGELEYLLQAVREVFPQLELSRGDVDMHYCGVRPLPKTSAAQTAAITRRHLLHVSDDSHVPIVSIIGGKLTTCRALAEEAVQLVLQRLQLPVRRNSRDRVIPGGERFPDSAAQVAAEQTRLAEQLQLTAAQVAAVWRLCGRRAAYLLTPPPPDAAETDGRDNLRGTELPLRFVRRVLRDEWCCQLEDLVERRLMLLYQPDLPRECLQHLAEVMAAEGLLAAEQVDAAVARCVERLRTHYGKAV